MKILKTTFTVLAIYIVVLFLYDIYLVKSYEKLQQELLEFEESLKVVEETPLHIITPVNCLASSESSEINTCKKIYDLTHLGWEDDQQNCRNQWIEFEFDERYFIEFMILENYEDDSLFYRKDKVRNIEIIFSDNNKNYYLVEEIQESQWFDINYITNTIRMNILTNYNDEDSNTCHIQEITFFGREITQ